MERWILLGLLVSLCLKAEAAVSVSQLHVKSVITHRFSTTEVKSVLVNEAKKAQQATFDVRLPKDAFISDFFMLIDGKEYPGQVAEKEKARKTYQAAVNRGESAGHVRASPRQSNKFAVSVNVEARKNVTFDLTYQELLARRLGVYEHVIYIDPGQTVADLMVEVFISESRVITDLSVPRLTNDLLTDKIIEDTNEFADIEMLSESSAYVFFAPSTEEQERFSAQGISGQFIVNYDVEHSSDDVGEILVSDGYFVHYFVPEWLEPINKRILFVLDTSGSMSGTKIDQLKQALVNILEEIDPGDEFGIITFNTKVDEWKGGEILPATENIVQAAKSFAMDLNASGGTNIDLALTHGINLLSQYSNETASMLFFLTDGEATVGETRSLKILENIRATNEGQLISIFCLAFGQDADYGLLQKISGQNNGVARRIYEDADASLQLAGFYDEISSPLLSELKIIYIGAAVDNASLTETELHCLFDGSEMVVAGMLREDYQNYSSSSVNSTGPVMNLLIEGNHVKPLVVDEEVSLRDTQIEDVPKLSPHTIRNFTHKLWVYLTIKQLIETTQQTTDPDEATAAKVKALDLSLKYGFVTPFTSMVVTKPSDEEKDKLEVVDERRYTDLTGGRSYLLSLNNNIGRDSYQYSSRGRSSGSGRKGRLHHRKYTSMKRPSSKPTRSKSKSRRRNKKKNKKRPSPKPTALPSYDYDYDDDYGFDPSPTNTYDYDFDASSIKTDRNKKKKTGDVYAPAIAIDTVAKKGSRGKRRKLCFDLPKELNQSVLSILKTDNIELTGKPSSRYGEAKKFQEISFKAANETLGFTVKGVTVGSGKVAAWRRLKFMKIDGWEVLSDGALLIRFGANSSLVVQKHGIKSRRSRAKPFLTLEIALANADLQGLMGILSHLFRPAYLSIEANKMFLNEPKTQSSLFYKYSLRTGHKCFRLSEIETVKNVLKI